MPLSNNLRVIITGASTGIGRGLALQLAKLYKAKLVLTARSEADLRSCAEEVSKLGGEAEYIAGDITKAGLSQDLANLCLTKYGGIDLLVNNAGMAVPGLVQKLTMADWRKVFDVNFFSALATTYACLDHLKSSPRGKIVNISSVAGKIAFPGSVSYCASKFALTALSNGLGAEMAPHNVDVITVCPGWVRTEFFEKNSVPSTRNPVLIAQQKDLKGFMMKHILSISTDQCVKEIVQSLNRDQSEELILTIPGKVAERLNGVMPKMVSLLSRRMNFDQD